MIFQGLVVLFYLIAFQSMSVSMYMSFNDFLDEKDYKLATLAGVLLVIGELVSYTIIFYELIPLMELNK